MWALSCCPKCVQIQEGTQVSEGPSAHPLKPQSPLFTPVSVHCAELWRKEVASASHSTPCESKAPFLVLEEGLLWKQSLKSPSTVMVKITKTITAMLTSMKTTVEEGSKVREIGEEDVKISVEITLPDGVTVTFGLVCGVFWTVGKVLCVPHWRISGTDIAIPSCPVTCGISPRLS